MRLFYILILLGVLSCAENKQELKVIESKAEDVVNVSAEIVKEKDSIPFSEIIESISQKSLPLIDDTSFDTFIDGYYSHRVNKQRLKLEDLYPNFHKEGYNYLPIDVYKLKLSENFFTVVVTIKKGDHEMESTLVNYDLIGNIIDYQVIAYDEIAEGMFRTESKITDNRIVVHQVVWEEEPKIKQVTYQILDDGIIDELDSKVLNEELSNLPIITITLEELKLNLLNIKTEFVVSEEHPDNPDDIIVVVPEIVEEGEHYFELNNHILIINARSGEVMQKFSQKGLTSDAVMLRDIKIDIGPYLVTENTHAFGILMYRYGTSRANPYENENIELFIKSGDTLKNVLYNFDIMDYGGERVADCEGEYLRTTSALMPLTTKTNGFFDIRVESEIIYTESSLDKDGECNATDKHSTQTKLLKFNGKFYE